MENIKYYLRIAGESYTIYAIEADKGAPEDGDIEISAIDYARFMEAISVSSLAQVKSPEDQDPEKGLFGYLEIFDRNQRYFRAGDERTFGFVIPDLFKIMPSDVLVTDEEYERYFEEEAKGKNFRCKEIMPDTGSLFDMIEEYTPEIPDLPPSPTQVLQEQVLQQQLATAEAIEKQEADKIELQLALAEFIESTMGGGE